jgi:hypothetical protein
MIGDMIPDYARSRAPMFGRNKNTGGYFFWSTPGLHEVHTSFTGPQWAGLYQPPLLYTYLVTTYPVPADLSAVTVGLTRDQKSVGVIQFHEADGKGTNIAGLDNILPDLAKLHDHLWIHFPMWPGEGIEEIYVIHRRADEFFDRGVHSPQLLGIFDGNSLVVSRTGKVQWATSG